MHHCPVIKNVFSLWAADSQRSGSKQSTNPADNYHLARRRTLQVVVSSLLTEAGFESAEKASVETLTEMLQSCKYLETINNKPSSSQTNICSVFCIMIVLKMFKKRKDIVK